MIGGWGDGSREEERGREGEEGPQSKRERERERERDELLPTQVPPFWHGTVGTKQLSPSNNTTNASLTPPPALVLVTVAVLPLQAMVGLVKLPPIATAKVVGSTPTPNARSSPAAPPKLTPHRMLPSVLIPNAQASAVPPPAAELVRVRVVAAVIRMAVEVKVRVGE